ncbi:DUF397 domain-containing protein [Streptomyces griseocarneus]|nr:DUF397 domain-containing protein [Streptomyces griseocarneus]
MTWRKSTYSGSTVECVEITNDLPHAIPVRDSKSPHGPKLAVPTPAWSAFVTHVAAPE